MVIIVNFLSARHAVSSAICILNFFSSIMPSSRSALCIRAVCSKQSPRSHLSVCGKCFCASLLMLQENSCSTEKRYTFSLCLFRFDSMPTFYFLLSESELLCSSCLCLKYSLSLNILSISKLKKFSIFSISPPATNSIHCSGDLR